jgi:hypothetical protein
MRAGEHIDDRCGACKLLRSHTVLATPVADGSFRVVCDYCGSQHNYRGGARAERPASFPKTTRASEAHAASGAFPIVSERERSHPAMSIGDAGGASADLEVLLRTIIREECGLTPVAPADKWRGGELVLRPGKPGVQEKVIPIETFFHKIVMLRNRLRVLEQQVNGLEVADDVKLKIQGYITGCYGTLTSFNVLFAAEADRFRGAGED